MIRPMMKPFFISIPHSGERVPDEASWLEGLPEPILMCDVDRFVDRLYQPVVRELHLNCVTTPWHRYAVDQNRLPEDIDQASVEDATLPPGKFSTGLHWVQTTRGSKLMPKPISRKLHDEMVQKYFYPFQDEIRAVYRNFSGKSETYHLDVHSMPSVGTAVHKDNGETRADVVISDVEGKSSSMRFKDLVIDAYQAAGFSVAYNWPYQGGRITQQFGVPDEGRNVIQVELNRACYMDEDSKQLIADKAAAVTDKLGAAIRQIHSKL